MNYPAKNQKSITDDFRAVYSYFVFPRVKRLFFAHLHQNKPKSLFCPIQERRKLGERGKTAQKLDFQGFFADRVVVPTTRYSVSFALLCETSPKQNTEKIELLFSFLGACALFSKFMLRFCKNVFEKAFYGDKKVLSRICALRGVGQQAPPLLLLAAVGRVVS